MDAAIESAKQKKQQQQLRVSFILLFYNFISFNTEQSSLDRIECIKQ